ncbi:MAG: hypothetical protein M3415_08395 [Actinomycetota bacterium]|jgi:uncharacterized membrane protein YczE|nr:hypothetical protein [Actinomycetota bacterium]
MTRAVAAPAASRWRATPAQLLRLLAGLWLFGTGEALLVTAGLGNTPWTVLAQGVSLHAPLSIGTATLVIGLLVLCGWLPLRERPGLGTVSNVVVIAVAIDVMLPLLAVPPAMAARAAVLLCGLLVIGAGSGLYLSAELGPGPRDGWMTGLHGRFGWPLSSVRLGIETAVLAAGWALGGTVGVGTAVFALLIGPAVGMGVTVLRRRPGQAR